MANQFANIKPPDLVAADGNGVPPDGNFVLIRRVSAISPLELVVYPRHRWFDARYLKTTVALFILPEGDIERYPEAFQFIYHQNTNTVQVELAPPEAEIHRPSDMDDDILLFSSVLETRINDFRVSGATAGATGEATGGAFSVRQILLEEVRIVIRLLMRRILLHAYTPLRSRIHFTNPDRAREAERAAEQHADVLAEFLLPRNAQGFLAPRDYPQIGDFPEHQLYESGDAGNPRELRVLPLFPFDDQDLRRLFNFASVLRGHLVVSRETDDAAKQYDPALLNSDLSPRFTSGWHVGYTLQNRAASVTKSFVPGEEGTLTVREQTTEGQKIETFPILGSIAPNVTQIIYFVENSSRAPAQIRYRNNGDRTPRNALTPEELAYWQGTNRTLPNIRFRWGKSEFSLRERLDITAATIDGASTLGSWSQNILPAPPTAGDLLFPITVGDDNAPEIVGPPIAILPTPPPIDEIGVSQFFENDKLFRFPVSGDMISDLTHGSAIFGEN